MQELWRLHAGAENAEVHAGQHDGGPCSHAAKLPQASRQDHNDMTHVCDALRKGLEAVPLDAGSLWLLRRHLIVPI